MHNSNGREKFVVCATSEKEEDGNYISIEWNNEKLEFSFLTNYF